ncbi:g10437 [Coccomyxa viridis]|uniref:G10437 protein n=1 Tax=Coccomyxa viridis TaxID=1274662 RepID=A0ABP1G5D7_9CHLO
MKEDRLTDLYEHQKNVDKAADDLNTKILAGVGDSELWQRMLAEVREDQKATRKAIELLEASHPGRIVLAEGVGKPCLGAAFTAQKLLEGKDVLLECISATSKNIVRHWYWLSMTSAIGRELFLGERVVFASPQEDLWRGQTKLAYTLLMVVPPASREELHDMKDAIPRFKRVTHEFLDEWFHWAGGSPRACLYFASSGRVQLSFWKLQVENTFHNADMDKLLRMTELPGCKGYIAESDKVFHWGIPDPDPAPENTSIEVRISAFTNPSTCFASPALQNMAVMVLELRYMVDLALKCSRGSGPEVGLWFEALQLCFLQKGVAELQARVLGDEEKHAIPFTIHNLPRTTVKHCHSMEGAAKVVKSDLSVLAVPLSKTETGFDFVQSSVAAWQVTIAKEHPTVRSAVTEYTKVMASLGAKVIADALAALNAMIRCPGRQQALLTLPVLLYAVPPKRYDSVFKIKQKYRVGTQLNTVQNDTIQQVAVRVPLDEILEQASAGSEEKAAEFLEQVEGLPLEGFSSVDAMKIDGEADSEGSEGSVDMTTGS